MPPATPTPAPEQHLRLIEEAYTSLHELFFRPTTSSQLLGSAWAGARTAATQFGISARLTLSLNGTEAENLRRFATAFLQLLSAIPASDRDGVTFAAAAAMAQSVHEQHTYFLPPAAARQMLSLSQGGSAFDGIGITLDTSRQPAVVIDVFKSSPADRAGVRPGDQIIAIDGHDLPHATANQITNALSGVVGTAVRLTLRNPQGITRTVKVVRAVIHPPVVESRFLQGGYCYVQLHSFPPADEVLPAGGTDVAEIRQALTQCDSQGGHAWILDLRDNPGGADVEWVAGLFLSTGVVSSAQDREGARYLLTTMGDPLSVQLPMAVLINGSSASSAEMLASALQDQHRAIVVGTHSAGIVNGTELVPLPLGAVIGVAVEQVLRGDTNEPLNGRGVTPTITVPEERPTRQQLAAGVDNVILAAEQALHSRAIALTPVETPMPTDTMVWSKVQDIHLLEPLLPENLAGEPHVARKDLVIDTLEGYASGAPNLRQALQRGARLSFEGEVLRRYGNLDDPDITISVSHYATAKGAHDDAAEVYLPDEQQNPREEIDVVAPIHLGDETFLRIGTGPSAGLVDLVWRSGNYIFDVQHAGPPGDEPLSQLIQIAEQVDTQFKSLRKPGGLLQFVP